MIKDIRTKQIVIIGAVVLLIAFLFTRDIAGLVKPKEDTTSAPATGEMAPVAAKEIDLEEVSRTGKNVINASLANEIKNLENTYKGASEDKKLPLAKNLLRNGMT
jgi:hypothetical protein